MDRGDPADLDRQAEVVGRLDPVDAERAVPGLVVDGEQHRLPGCAAEIAEDGAEDPLMTAATIGEQRTELLGRQD